MANNKRYTANLNKLKEGRRNSQQQVIDYFLATSEGCLGKKIISDAEYAKMLKSHVSSLNIDERSLNKLAIDISQVQEIEPVTFAGYDFANEKALVKRGRDGKWRSSAYQITKIYFSDKQIYFYQYNFDMTNNEESEFSDEYFYKDITNFSSMLETVERKVVISAGGCLGGVQAAYETIQYSSFRIVVPGDIKKCSKKTSFEVEQAIKGMMSKLREKKGE